MLKNSLFFLMVAFFTQMAAAEKDEDHRHHRADSRSELERKRSEKAKHLGIHKGAVAVGGNASVDYFSSEINYYGGFYAQIEASYYYFLMDGLAFGVNLGAASTIQRIAVAPTGSLGVSLEYFFETGSIAYPYLGVGVGIEWKALDPSSQLWAPVKPGVGVLIALSDAVALDLGINTEITFALAGDALPLLDGTAGFVGVRAFF